MNPILHSLQSALYTFSALYNLPLFKKHNNGKKLPNGKKVWATDTFTDVNGVAVVIKKMAEIGVKHHHDLVIVVSTNDPITDSHIPVKNFKPVGDFKLPQNDTFTLAFPPFLEIVQFLEENEYTEVIISTPGTVGLTLLGAAKLLNLKVTMIYHTDFPGYVRYYTNDVSMEEIAWRFMIWFYDQADTVYVPSSHYKNQLVRKGIASSKMKMFPHGTDIESFNPNKRSATAFSTYGLHQEKKVIYVGRVAKEKDLDILPEVWRLVQIEIPSAVLVIVGDGPYMNELKLQMKNYHVIFTGFMKGEALYQAFASSDVFVFPSTTDTFGNVVIESLASGCPAIVSNIGGPKDIVRHGVTGYVTEGKNPNSIANALIEILTNDEKRKNMSAAARSYAETQSWETIYMNFWTGK